MHIKKVSKNSQFPRISFFSSDPLTSISPICTHSNEHFLYACAQSHTKMATTDRGTQTCRPVSLNGYTQLGCWPQMVLYKVTQLIEFPSQATLT